MLRAPNYGLAIPPLQCFKWETTIANAIIDNMKKNDGICIPTNLQKDALPMLHINNIDRLEDTADGKRFLFYTAMAERNIGFVEISVTKLIYHKDRKVALMV